MDLVFRQADPIVLDHECRGAIAGLDQFDLDRSGVQRFEVLARANRVHGVLEQFAHEYRRPTVQMP